MNRSAAKIKAIISAKASADWVFSAADFLDVESRTAVSGVLSRMAKSGLVRRLARGFYDVPQFNALLNDYAPPSHEQVILAITRRYDIKIIADNVVHANGLGLTNAVPAKLIYLTNGSSKSITIGGWTLKLKHVSSTFMGNADSSSGPLFQALTWLGQSVVGASIDLPAKIRSSVSSEALADAKMRAGLFPPWMRPVIDAAITK